MKKNFIGRSAFLAIYTMLFLLGCKDGAHEKLQVKNDQAKDKFTCAMHLEVIRDAPGNCPICGMALVSKKALGQAASFDTTLTQTVKPVNEQVVARAMTIIPESGIKVSSVKLEGITSYDSRRQTSIASRVSGRIERLYIKYNYQAVKKGQLIMEIYSPDLSAAQQELLYLKRSDGAGELFYKAEQRLLLLGMRRQEIQQVLSTNKIFSRVPVYSDSTGFIFEGSSNLRQALQPNSYLAAQPDRAGMGSMTSDGSPEPTSAFMTSTGKEEVTNSVIIREGEYVNAGQSLFLVYNNTAVIVDFSIPASLEPFIKKGQHLSVKRYGDSQTLLPATISFIKPTIRIGESFAIARSYISDRRLRPGELVTASINVSAEGWWVPESTILQLGTRAIVFRHEGKAFVPKEVSTGVLLDGLMQITSDIGGWELARQAAFLVDSESFIKIDALKQNLH